MGRSYAGILGLIAFSFAIARGLFVGGETEGIVFHAWLSLLAFSAIGFVIGALAQGAIDESVRRRLADEMSARETPRPGA